MLYEARQILHNNKQQLDRSNLIKAANLLNRLRKNLLTIKLRYKSEISVRFLIGIFFIELDEPEMN